MGNVQANKADLSGSELQKRNKKKGEWWQDFPSLLFGPDVWEEEEVGMSFQSVGTCLYVQKIRHRVSVLFKRLPSILMKIKRSKDYSCQWVKNKLSTEQRQWWIKTQKSVN